MLVTTIPLSQWGVNCYLVQDEETSEGIVIDPGGEPDRILWEAQRLLLRIRLIVNTHGHGDHIGGNKTIQEAVGVPIAIGALDSEFLTNPSLNLSTLMTGEPFVSPPAGTLLQDGDEIRFGESILRVLDTPGHTPGGICLVGAELAFTGDTLFAGSIGRSDFPYSSPRDLGRSLRALLELPDELVIFPGHGPSTTLGAERRTNPFLTDTSFQQTWD